MLVLAIDTATPDLVIGLVSDGECIADTSVPNSRDHNERLIPHVHAALLEAQATMEELEAIVVGVGPGPFTGLRVGMVTAASLGDALGIPVHGVCTLDAIAVAAGERESLLVATDARRREIYWARYAAGQRVEGPEVGAPGQLSLNHRLPQFLSVPAHLYQQLPAEVQELDNLQVQPTPSSLVLTAERGYGDLSLPAAPVVPLYLRRPDAKEPTPRPPSPAIPQVNHDSA